MRTGATFRQDDQRYAVLTLDEQIAQLTQDGWSSAAIKQYQMNVERLLETRSFDQQATQMRLWFDAHRIGSEIFTDMLMAEFKPSQENATARIAMLEQVMGLELDAENFVQMTRLGFWSERGATPTLYYLYIGEMQQLRTYIDFTNRVARLMYAKYQTRTKRFFGQPSMTMLNDVVDHQLRYYLGKPMIDFARTQNMTRVGLKQSAQKFLHRQVRYPDARYHNRGVADASNLKIVTHDYHSEFILDKHDQLVSIWNALEAHQVLQEDGSVRFDLTRDAYTIEELQQIANTESLNYANHGGKIHDLLDGDPSVRGAGYEPAIRDYAKTLF
ncbi:DUF3114 domain-containing protein [Weissella viridescens]|uniref:DUF3114 domain-containing protein n=1 Tax=Weissella viridescens TaxID=1629 RepID=A0A3P2RBF3_WEIVI|nr:DUF3114 domain-containing protein [Weissella viridescens]RRG17864.1 DUF3114 domain-containing protein [Weissella viridescens]